MKLRHVFLWGTLCVGTFAACGGGSDDPGGNASGGKGGKASGGKGGSASGGKGGGASGGKGGSASGGSTAGSGGTSTATGGSSGGTGGAVVSTGGVGQGGAVVGALADGLIGYWPFDEGQGTAVKDMSGKDNNGIVVEGLTEAAPLHAGPKWVEGHKGKAMALDGVDDWIRVARSDSIDSTGTSGSASVAAWVKLNQFGQATANSPFNFLLNRHEVGTAFEHFGLGLQDGKPTAAVHFFFASAAEVVNVNGWSHMAMTYDGITLSVYVNGILGSSLDVGWPIAADTTNIVIGAGQNIDVLKEFIDGSIDEVYLYSRSLSADDVKAVMNAK